MPNKQAEFTMGVPARYGRSSNFAFWMTASDRKLLTAVRGMGCVAGMKRSRLTGRILVEISDDHDPDEAWHWIRKEIEDTIKWIL